MKNSVKHFVSGFFAIVLVAFTALACESPDDDSAPASLFDGSGVDITVTRITAKDIGTLSDGSTLIVNARNKNGALVLDTSYGELDYGRIELICPNGQQMRMDTWLLNASEEEGFDLASTAANGFSVGLNQENTLSAMNPRDRAAPTMLQPLFAEGCFSYCCGTESCYQCPDGAWICTCSKKCNSCISPPAEP